MPIRHVFSSISTISLVGTHRITVKGVTTVGQRRRSTNLYSIGTERYAMKTIHVDVWDFSNGHNEVIRSFTVDETQPAELMRVNTQVSTLINSLAHEDHAGDHVYYSTDDDCHMGHS